MSKFGTCLIFSNRRRQSGLRARRLRSGGLAPPFINIIYFGSDEKIPAISAYSSESSEQNNH
jgi:hypothetical protein